MAWDITPAIDLLGCSTMSVLLLKAEVSAFADFLRFYSEKLQITKDSRKAQIDQGILLYPSILNTSAGLAQQVADDPLRLL